MTWRGGLEGKESAEFILTELKETTRGARTGAQLGERGKERS